MTKLMIKPGIFFILIFGICINLNASNKEYTATDKPNIIIILVDDMGYSDLACYGSEIQTPNLDYLAENGLRFTQFYNAARCCPTRASLLTGLYPHQAGMGHMAGGNYNIINSESYQGNIKNSAVTIADVLKGVGYFTSMTGKWHVGGYKPSIKPPAHGFDRSFCVLQGVGFYSG